MSARTLLRAFQQVRGVSPDPAFIADLEYLQNRDLDLSVRHGAMLALDALLITAAINPISASPGAPLSLDAATQPGEVIVVCIGLLLLVASTFVSLRAMLIGEEYDTNEIADDPAALTQRLFAAFCRSVDAQKRLLSHSVWLTRAGGGVTLGAWAWILSGKMV